MIPIWMFLATVYALLVASILIIEKLKRIIIRYEQLLEAHGIPHSRRKHGPKGFYNHAVKPW